MRLRPHCVARDVSRGDQLRHFTVGDTGHVYLPQKLNAGSYYLREVSAPEGYLLGHADVPFTVSTTTD
ncbi:MAG: prealbumin-like fold domain-containing protein [Eggerthellaceae bacterium]